MTKINFAIIGTGKCVSDCISIIEKYNTNHTETNIDLRLVLLDAKYGTPTQTYGYRSLDVLNINSDLICELLKNEKIDYLLSVNNHQILAKETINSVRQAVLNFHNGPLPRYGGVNVCAWSIFNGETEHGITWHIMDSNIDSGDIITQVMFPIGNSETAISLIMKCIKAGMNALEKILPDVCRGQIISKAQDPSEKLYYSYSDIPSGGFFNFKWRYIEADRYMRCLNVYPFEQMLPFGSVAYKQRIFYITRIRKQEKEINEKPGTIISVSENEVITTLSDCTIQIIGVLDEHKRVLSINDFIKDYSIKAGDGFEINKGGSSTQ